MNLLEEIESRLPAFVYRDGISSLFHALLVLGAFYLPALIFMPLGLAAGGYATYFYGKREISDFRNATTKAKKADAIRDFLFAAVGAIIGLGLIL